MSYVRESTETKKRVTVDIERFLADMCEQLGPAAYLVQRDDPQPYTGLSNIRFRDLDYELTFEFGTGMAAGPNRVYILCQLVAGPHIAAITIGAQRPMTAIVSDVRKKIIDVVDELAEPARQSLLNRSARRERFLVRLERFGSNHPDLKLYQDGAYWHFEGHLRPAQGGIAHSGEISGVIHENAISLQINVEATDALFEEIYGVLKRYKVLV